jgi:hypothetical protein
LCKTKNKKETKRREGKKKRKEKKRRGGGGRKDKTRKQRTKGMCYIGFSQNKRIKLNYQF